jgi:hypothetical protein
MAARQPRRARPAHPPSIGVKARGGEGAGSAGLAGYLRAALDPERVDKRFLVPRFGPPPEQILELSRQVPQPCVRPLQPGLDAPRLVVDPLPPLVGGMFDPLRHLLCGLANRPGLRFGLGQQPRNLRLCFPPLLRGVRLAGLLDVLGVLLASFRSRSSSPETSRR